MTDLGVDHLGVHPRLHNFNVHVALEPAPAQRIHGVKGDIVEDAMNGVSDVLPARHHHRKNHEDDNCRFVMQVKHFVVDAHVIDLKQSLEAGENVEHDGSSSRTRSRDTFY